MQYSTVGIYHKLLGQTPVQDSRVRLVSAANRGFATSRGFGKFIHEVDQFFNSIIEGNRNPHTWDKLLGRARGHGCNAELRRYEREFSEALTRFWKHQREIEGKNINTGD